MTQQTKSPRSWRRRILRLLLILLIPYVGILVLLLFLERKLIFFPTTAKKSWVSAPDSIHAEDVTLTISKGVSIHAWWCSPKDWTVEKGAMLFCHGNAGNLSHRGDRIRLFHEHLGLAVMIFDYPGYGKSTGKPSEKGCYESAEVARDWILEKGIAPEKIIFAGTSLGGGVAIEMATRHPCRALVSVSTFTSIPDMAAKQFPWLPSRPFIRNRFENLKKIEKCEAPLFLAHGTSDSLIPFEMGETLFATAREPKVFHTMQGKDHNDAPDESFYQDLKKFLNSLD